MMEYFVVSKSCSGLAHTISNIFKNSKDVKVINDRRSNKNNYYVGPERRKFNKFEKVS